MERIKRKILEIDKKKFKGNIFLFYNSPSLDIYRHIRRMTKEPIIIGGCGRSGTTLLLSLLSSHPSIFAIPEETGAFCKSNYTNQPLQKENFKIDIIYNYLLQETKIEVKKRWCEKTPKNVHRISEILDYFGTEVRFINIVRDGRDVITSRHPNIKNEFWVTPKRWIEDVEAGFLFRNNPNVLTVKYEDLILQSKTVMKKISDFIDEEYGDYFENYPASASIKVSNAWFNRANELHSNSIGRWKKYKYRDLITEFLKNPKAIQLLKYYNYIK